MLHQYEKALLKVLIKGRKEVSELCDETGLSRDSVVRALYWLKERGAVNFDERKTVEYRIGREGRRFLSEGFPEIRVIRKVGEGILLDKLSLEEKAFGIPWAKRNGWIEIVVDKEGKKIVLTDKGRKALKEEYPFQAALERLAQGNVEGGDSVVLDLLSRRGNILRKHIKTIIRGVELTKEGRRMVSEVEMGKEINVLTKSLIVSGGWRDVKLRPYEIKSPGERIYPGKTHPLRRVIDKVRRVFLEMGFEEMRGDMIVSSFWNFDALFQPQDHPARDLADTFYLTRPDRIEIPDEELAEKVRKAHERGWRYKWRKEEAERPVLRTHTTAVSAKYLAETGKGLRKAPAKYFCIGRVYRNEAIDFKHLAEFHQVDGIVVDENATFADLLGLLKEFYRKLGFEKIRFRPSYFPYTEPSLEVEVFFEKRGEWMEFGGAGIFRPEVCIPLWGRYPVLAWGLSLERPAMLLLGLDDIRTFYKNDLGWLRETKITEGLG